MDDGYRVAKFKMSMDLIRELIGLGSEYEVTNIYGPGNNTLGDATVVIEGSDLRKVALGEKIPEVQIIATKVYSHPEYIKNI